MTTDFHDRSLFEGASLGASSGWAVDDALALQEDWAEEADQVEEDEIADRIEDGIAIHTEKLADRQRRIHAITDLPFTAQQLWQILTDYDNLAEFIPNLVQSRRLSHPEGGIRLEQVGAQSLLNVRFCARVVLDTVEVFPRELRFTMVEGDFRKFEGKWTLSPLAGAAAPRTRLGYDLLICPPRAMPAGLLERHIRHDLSRNLHAIGERAATLFGVAESLLT
jgi:ribosome-associated toxin RatA of RatAB toxin-antitoxin module